MSDPSNLHLLSSSVFKEKLLRNDLMSILSTEIDVCKILLAVKSRTDTFSLEINLKICTIVYDNV